jgi:hypothetical protein
VRFREKGKETQQKKRRRTEEKGRTEAFFFLHCLKQ